MLSRNWNEYDKPIISGILEDFIIFKEGEKYTAYYCKGDDFTRLNLFKSESYSMFGPFVNEEKIMEGKHLRICKGKIDNKRRLLTFIRPGLPKAGIWLLIDTGNYMIRKLLIEPEENTLYSVLAGNPTVIHDGKEYNIFFEGRNVFLDWRVFQAVWDGKDSVEIIKEPLLTGANPFVTKFGDKYYLYYSKWNRNNEFDVRVMYQ